MKLTELSADEIQRYTHQIRLCEIGLSGQMRLKSASVGVIGAGGLGCTALQHLAAAGVGKIGIIDHDRIVLSNLQRQILYHHEDIGKLKCEIAKRRLALINPHVLFESKEAFLSTDNGEEIIQDYDVIIDATDNATARYAINDACLQTSKPFVYGSIYHFEGQVAVFNALDSTGNRGPDYRFLYPVPIPHGIMPSCAEGGVVGALPGIVGSIQALEAMKLILEIRQSLSGKLLKIDTLAWQMRLYQIGSQSLGVEPPFEIAFEKLKEMLLEEADLQLVDVREDAKNFLINLGVLSIPFSRLRDEYWRISKEKTVVLVCQKGFRSMQAAKMLRDDFHYEKVYSLKEGLLGLTNERRNGALDHVFPGLQ